MKGKRKEISKKELHKLFATGFGTKKINSEYGMTELLSQSYSNSDLNFEKGTSTDFLPLIKPFLILVKQSDIGS